MNWCKKIAAPLIKLIKQNSTTEYLPQTATKLVPNPPDRFTRINPVEVGNTVKTEIKELWNIPYTELTNLKELTIYRCIAGKQHGTTIEPDSLDNLGTWWSMHPNKFTEYSEFGYPEHLYATKISMDELNTKIMLLDDSYVHHSNEYPGRDLKFSESPSNRSWKVLEPDKEAIVYAPPLPMDLKLQVVDGKNHYNIVSKDKKNWLAYIYYWYKEQNKPIDPAVLAEARTYASELNLPRYNPDDYI